MATILKFRVRSVQKRAAASARRARSAEIVIFPGVRYHRWSEPSSPGEKRGKIKRDTLKLAD